MLNTADVSTARLVLEGLTEEANLGRMLAVAAEMPELLRADYSERVPSEYLTRLWHSAIVGADEPLLGVKAASHWRLGRLHLADYLFETSATLAEALGTMERYYALLNTAHNEIRVSSTPMDAGTLTFQVRSGEPAVDAQATQFALGLVLSRARHAVGREIRPLSLTFASEAPARYRELGARFGARRLKFGAEHSTMTLAPADLSLRLHGADPALAEVLRRHAAHLLATQSVVPPATASVRQIIAQQLTSGGPSLTEAARRLALSPRTLQRRLANEGAAWRDLVDAVRRDRAAALEERGLSRAAAAASLGFSDARALRAAARRWRA